MEQGNHLPNEGYEYEMIFSNVKSFIELMCKKTNKEDGKKKHCAFKKKNFKNYSKNYHLKVRKTYSRNVTAENQ